MSLSFIRYYTHGSFLVYNLHSGMSFTGATNMCILIIFKRVGNARLGGAIYHLSLSVRRPQQFRMLLFISKYLQRLVNLNASFNVDMNEYTNLYK